MSTPPDGRTQPPHVGTSPSTQPSGHGDMAAVVTIIALGALASAFLLLMSLLSGMMTDPCMSSQLCDIDRFTIAWGVAVIAPPIAFVASAIWGYRRSTHGRTGWWVPLLGILLGWAVWLAAYAVMTTSIVV